MLPMAVAHVFSNDNAIMFRACVLRIALCFPVMGPVGQNHACRYVSSSSLDGGTWAKLLYTTAG